MKIRNISSNISFKQNEESRLKRNVAIGTSLGILTSGALLTRGKVSNLIKMDYSVGSVMSICLGSALGGYLGAAWTTPKNAVARDIELKNQLIYNDFFPLIMMKGTDLLYKTKSKLKRSLVLAISLFTFTYIGHKLAEKNLKEKGLKTNYPVEPCHLIAELDDYMLPIAIATKSKPFQNLLKIASPITFFPLGMSVGMTENKKYYA